MPNTYRFLEPINDQTVDFDELIGRLSRPAQDALRNKRPNIKAGRPNKYRPGLEYTARNANALRFFELMVEAGKAERVTESDKPNPVTGSGTVS